MAGCPHPELTPGLDREVAILLLNLSRLRAEEQILNEFLAGMNALGYHLVASDEEVAGDMAARIGVDGPPAVQVQARNAVAALSVILDRCRQDRLLREENRRLEESLRLSQERASLALEAGGYAAWEWDVPTGGLHFSPGWYVLLGYAPGEFPASLDSFTALLHPEDRDTVWERIWQDLGGPAGEFRVEFRMRAKSGGWRWILSHGRTVTRTEAGEPERVIGTHVDETDRKVAESEYRTVVDTALDGFICIDGQGRFLDANAAYCRMIGYPRAELLGMAVKDVEAEDSPAVIVRRLGHVAREGGQRFTSRHRTRDHHLLDLEISITYSGERGCFYAFLRDMTSRNRVVGALERSERQFRLIWEASSDGMVLADRNGTVLLVNESYCQMVGRPRAEIENRPFTDPYAETGRQWIPAIFTGTAAKHLSIPLLEADVVLHDGRRRHFDVAVSTIEGGGHAKALGVFRDITARRSLEEQYRQSQKLESIGRLAGGVAHDFNNLLTIIQGYSRMVLDRLDQRDPLYIQVQEVLAAGERGSNLTRQLLAFSRRQVVEPSVLDPNRLIVELERMLRRLIGEDVRLDIAPAPDVPMVRADAGQIQQVLMNLAVNARDAMPDGGVLRIATAVAASRVVISVSDTGTGMSAEVLSHLYEPFFTTKPRDKGTGLGLATVYGIVQQNKGEIRVTTEEGKGTTFEIALPAIDEPASARPGPDLIAARGAGQTILVVEDQQEVRRLAVGILRQCGYAVLEASGGDEALALLGKHTGPLDLVLTDVVMPVMNGFQLAERLRGIRPGLRVIFMSGYPEKLPGDGVEPLSFLPKPFSPAALAAIVAAAVNGATAP